MKTNNDEFMHIVTVFSRFFDLIHQPITIIDKEGKFIYYNQESADIDGYSIELALGKSVTEVYGLLEDNSTLLQALNQGKEFIGNYQIYYNKKGQAVEFQHTTVPIYDDNKEIQGVIEIGRNMTAARLLQEQVVELNSLLFNHNRKEQRHEIVTADPKMLKLIEQTKRLAINNVPIMIVGETGTGKELFARLIHNTSQRAKKPFIALNCSTIPETLIESTLFGTVKGAFTGAENRLGYLELADGGTLFLDELNSMPLSVQSKLLRFCQDKVFWKVGGFKQQISDIRIITALNESPQELVKQGRLRSDLYYRLCVGQVAILPLRARLNDMRLLANYFLEKHSNTVAYNITGVGDSMVEQLKNFAWPGNVRMLENVIVRSMLLQEQDGPLQFLAYDQEVSAPIPLSVRMEEQHPATNQIEYAQEFSLEEEVEAFEKQLIINAINTTNGNIAKAAKLLKISRTTLHYKVKKHQLTLSINVV